MLKISEIDKNLSIKETICKDGLVFYDVLQQPFGVYGLMFPDKEYNFFKRLPFDVAYNSKNVGIVELNHHTAGGRLRFSTTSKKVAIIASMHKVSKMSHFALTGSAGFDLYVNGVYEGSFIPPFDMEQGYESLISLSNNDKKEIEINFPLYSGVNQLWVGLDENAEVFPAKNYRDIPPIVYYGSSITQGGCASRPGSSYQSIIERISNIDYINLGFSGSAKAEDNICDYIASLNMSLFVMDYDHNAPSVEHLEKTHEKLFLTVRNKRPNLPIIIVPKPDHYNDPDRKQRFAVIKQTYDNAIARGDKNVYFVDICKQLYERYGNNYTVDGCHPTDLGFLGMANILWDVIKTIL